MPDGSAPTALSGAVHTADYFRFVEREELDWNVWNDVLLGRVAGAMFRRVLEPEVCESIQSRFWSSPLLKRSTEGTPLNGNACGPLLVANSSLDAYLDEVERTRPAIDTLFEGPGRAVPALLDECGRRLAQQGIRLRVAEHWGRQAGRFKVRSRASEKSFALAPHEDAMALRSLPHLAGFEIQESIRLYSVVACLKNDTGGELLYWNIAPDQETSQAMGAGTDPRYPVDALEGFDSLTIPVRTGDVYVFDAHNIHAVGQRHADEAVRCSVQWTMGVLDDTTIVHWA